MTDNLRTRAREAAEGMCPDLEHDSPPTYTDNMVRHHQRKAYVAGYLSHAAQESSRDQILDLADWHDTKAEKARQFRPEIDGENRVMDKAAEVHKDAARRLRELLNGED